MNCLEFHEKMFRQTHELVKAITLDNKLLLEKMTQIVKYPLVS